MGRPLRQAHQELQHAHDSRQRPQALAPRGQAVHEATRQGEATPAGGRRWEAIQSAERQRLETLALTRPPLRLGAAAPQTSAPGERAVHAPVEAMEALAHTPQVPERQAAMTQGTKQVPALAALVDCW